MQDAEHGLRLNKLYENLRIANVAYSLTKARGLEKIN